MVRINSPQVKRVIIVHGWEGSPGGDWMPWLRNKLKNKGFDVIIPAMPNPDVPIFNDWLDKLKNEIANPDQNTYLIEHSLGCITILRFLESLRDKQKVGGVIFIAGFAHDLEYEGYKGELHSFFETPVNWNKIKSKANKFVIIHSKDDEWVPVKHNRIYQEKLGAESIVLDGYGHFSGDEGVTEVPVVLEKLLEIAK